MKPIRILIVEDENITAASIRMTLEQGGYRITDVVNSGELALASVKKEMPDLILMDIHLLGKFDGITTAKSIKKQYPIPIIFITQYEDDEEMFNNAKETTPQNYLTKPFTNAALIRAVELAIQSFSPAVTAGDRKSERNRDSIFIPTSKGYKVKFFFKDILYIQAKAAYSRIFFAPLSQNDGTKPAENYIDVSLSSNQLTKQLNYKSILRIHKSYHVNLDKVDKISATSVFIGDIEISIGPEYNNDILKSNLNIITYHSK